VTPQTIDGLPHGTVRGNWNKAHTAWTTVDGKFKIVRRSASKGVEAAWILYFVPSAKGAEFKSYGSARKAIAEVLGARPALMVVPEKNKGQQ
jgi:hypothetical protein